eukprot:1539564-Pleurochrysis_carterae.AAC.1
MGKRDTETGLRRRMQQRAVAACRGGRSRRAGALRMALALRGACCVLRCALASAKCLATPLNVRSSASSFLVSKWSMRARIDSSASSSSA